MASLRKFLLVGWVTILIALSGSGMVVSHNPGTRKPTNVQLQFIKELIKNIFEETPDLLPKAVRLAFHDCVGPACDGCINLENPDNKGLAPIIDPLKSISSNTAVRPFLGTADLWSLAGIVAVEEGIRISNEACKSVRRRRDCQEMPPLTTPFMWGRPDCDTSPYSSDSYAFPSPTMSREQMMGYFKQNFRMNEYEVTALMGAHTLGKTQITNSGYSGSWINNEENHFNSHFYRLIRQTDATFQNVAMDVSDANGDGDKKFQFSLVKNGILQGNMLNTDIELVYHIDVSKVNGTQCLFGEGRVDGTRHPRRKILSSGSRTRRAMENGQNCPFATSAMLVDRYIKEPASFIWDFSAVYKKMMDHGNPDLQRV